MVSTVCLILLCILLSAVLSASLPTRSLEAETQHTGEMHTQTPSGENKAVEAARMHLSKQINVDVAFTSLDSAERVWWPDNCLGLPRPAERCEPVRTPGLRIVLVAGEYRFIYRTDITGENVRFEDLSVGNGWLGGQLLAQSAPAEQFRSALPAM